MASETEIVHVIDDDEALRDSLTFLLRAAKEVEVQELMLLLRPSSMNVLT